jgi:hypothetical protein
MVVSITYEHESTRLTWYLRRGEKAILGNSPWCDFVLPAYTEQRNVCCTVHLEDSLFVEADSDAELPPLNNQTCSIALQSSDTFHLQSYPIAVTFLAPSNHASRRDEGRESDQLLLRKMESIDTSNSHLWFDYASIPRTVSMSDTAAELFLSFDQPKMAIDKLISQELLEDAVRGLAGMLPLKRLIDWCIDMLDTSGVNIEPNMRTLLRQWQSNPLSVSKGEMAAIVKWNDNSNPWTHLLAAVSWVEPNANSSQTWCTEPALSMIIASVIASLQLATASVKAEPFRRSCADKGLKLLELSLSDATAGGPT